MIRKENLIMCGIVGYVGEKQCTDILVGALQKLEYRGYDSAGIAVFSNDRIKTIKAKGKIAEGLIYLIQKTFACWKIFLILSKQAFLLQKLRDE